jgi:hypothetical protein
LGDPAGNNATAGLALRVTGTYKPLPQDKVEIARKNTAAPNISLGRRILV